MARQGRQPQVTAKPVKAKKVKTAKPAAAPSKKSKGTGSALDIYSFSSSVKKPRGDVDPASRPSSSKSGKGKGKKRQGDSEEEDEDEESEDGSEEEFDRDAVLEFTGVKPKNLYMGGGSDGEAEVIASEDDEDIDSDEAWDEEDDLPVKKSKKGKGKAVEDREQEIDLDEEELDYDDEEGAAFMDLSELLDNGEYASDEEDSDDEDDSEPELKRAHDSEEDEDEGSSDESEEEEEEEEDDMEEDEEVGGALNKLGSFVESLENKKRKAIDDDDAEGGGKKKKRVVLKERTEAYPEGEFVAVSTPDGGDSGKVSLDDLLSSFANSKNPRLAALRKTLKPLAAASTTQSPSTSTSRSHLKSSGPLAAPLPGRLQDKIEREAAYEKTKEETDKWNETVRRMKGESGLGVEGARHERLTLPLMSGMGDPTRDGTAAELSAKFEASNDLEASIQTLLAAGQMQTSDLQRAEKAALQDLDPVELAARQAELRQQRDLMFRAERKAKRVAKIKSKAFRRIHRKSKKDDGGPGLSLEDMEELDRIDGGDRVTEERARLEMVRARERATLKHSTKGGKWSKSVGDIQGLDEERNTAVREMVKRGEELRKRIAGVDDDDDSDGYGEDSEEEDDSDADVDQIRRTAFDELAALDAKDKEAAASAPALKGVLNMKFMKDAVARGERKVQGEADELRRKLEMMDDAEDRDEDDDEVPVALSETVDGNLGRMIFGPSAGSLPSTSTSSSATAPSTTTTKTSHNTKLSAPLTISSSIPSRSQRSLLSSQAPVEEGESNPWLTTGDEPSTGKVSRKMNKAIVGKDSKDAARSAARVDRHKSKQAGAREEEQNDERVELDLDVVLKSSATGLVPQLGGPSKKAKKGVKFIEGAKANTVAGATQEESEESDEDENDEEDQEAQRGSGPAAFKQRDLVAKAFAGDDVVADFQAEKQREIERDAPKEEDNTLPGWGAWSGKGVKKAKNAKKFITKIPGIAPAARKDASFSNVIISEKKDKKAAKYQLKDLPFPYTSAAQHEHKLRTPLGHEWSTSTIVRDQTLPKVQIKPGVTIRPVDKKV